MAIKNSNWDKKHYQEIYDFMIATLSSVPWCSNVKCPFEWAKSKLPLITMSIEKEDYEAAQATKDAIKNFLNRFLDDENKITNEATLKLPTAGQHLREKLS
ncbi:hypothetical protein [Mucilaginibacter lappiensis]|uniref:Uncharacterized protein n=1 Tax=Mucilaginibacter lappiensis TaxID=354630 RepID=A0A841JET1_9SPHI|nr:hypothetical protein [Mucilaginibacter lappiensis]MBB6126955.1 hypothetical protein [Mucilaginibacter lappiensis]